jgi:MinD-like ATPase involved in chromosome partitioning or flagellar assembly
MTLLAVASLHGSPGASTLAAALGHELNRGGRATLLVEADPDGGVLAARYDLPLSPSLTDLAGAARRTVEVSELAKYAQRLGGILPVVVAHPSAEQTASALRASAASLAQTFVAADFNVVADVGRWRPDSPSLSIIEAASTVLVVARPSLEDVVRLTSLASSGSVRDRVQVVLVGERPYDATQVTEATALSVLTTLPVVRSIGHTGQRDLGGRQRRLWMRRVALLAASLGVSPDKEMGLPTH